MKHRVCNRCKCPYYRHEDTQVIYCDGVTDASVIHLAFANGADARKYTDDVCRNKYEDCKIYKMLEREN